MITENEKLFIEKFKKSDISEWSKIESDPKVRHFVDGKKQTYKQSEEYIKKNILSYDNNGFGRYAVRFKKNKQLPVVSFLGVSYKENSNDVRGAPAVQIIEKIIKKLKKFYIMVSLITNPTYLD